MRDAGFERDERERIASVERQGFNRFLRDHVADRGVVGLQAFIAAFDVDDLVRLADFERNVR